MLLCNTKLNINDKEVSTTSFILRERVFMARETKKLFSTTPEQIAKINPENLQLIEEFMDYYEATDHTEKSLKVTRSNLNIFFVWLMEKGRNKDFCNVKKKDILAFQSYLVKEGLSPARIRALKSSLSSLSKYIEDILDEEEKWEGFRNIVNKVPSPVLSPVREKTMLNDDQVVEVLNALVEKKKYQHACALALAWCSGSRKAELLRFKMSYINDKNLRFGGNLYMTPEPIKTKGRGKQGKLLEKYILADKFKPYFDLWQEERERMGVPSTMDEMFITKHGDTFVPMQESHLDSYAKTFSRMFGCHFYFHCMRHACCTGMLRAGLSAQQVCLLFGWASVDMVNVYDDRSKDEIIGDLFGEGSSIKL